MMEERGILLKAHFLVLFLWGILGIALGQSKHEFLLNGTWHFQTDPNNFGESEGWFKPDFEGSAWDKMEVPGNWDLRNEFAHYVGKGWYQKTFFLPAELKGKTLILHFGAVYHDCTVWLNGQKIGTNNSGFLPFEFEVTDMVHADQENVITVCADNTFKRGAIWNWGGIRRPVSIMANDGLRILHQHITPEVDLEEKEAKVAVRIFLENYSSAATEVTGEVLLTNKNGYKRSLPFSANLPAKSKEEVMVSTVIDRKDYLLWHFDDPFLYESEVRLDNRDSPAVSNKFGLRKIEVDSLQYQLKLNGESVRLMGLNLVPDGRTTGNTLPLWRIKQDVDLLKSLGGNFTRLSHLPLPGEMMEYLDERGILVFSEIPLWGYDPLADPDNPLPFEWLERLVYLQYNHPSVVGWSTGNEIGNYPTANAYVKKSIDFVRDLDSTRLVSNVTYTAQNEEDYIRYTDLGLLNKYGQNLAPVTRLQHSKHPNKVMFYSEYGIGQFNEGLDATFEIKPFIDSIRHLPYLVGASLWTYNDYRSSYQGTKEWSENRPWGVVDVYRRKKQAFYDLQKEHAPVKGFSLSSLESNKADLKISPRDSLDLPAYIMRNYKVVYNLYDETSEIVDGGFMSLPEVSPGDDVFQQTFEWYTNKAKFMKVTLLNPQADILLDTAVYFDKPIPPGDFEAFAGRTQHNNVSPNSGGIRVFYEKNEFATAYKIKYGIETMDMETHPGNDDYIDIRDLALDETYRLQLVAINPQGESSSEPVQIKVDQRNYLPPGVRYVEPSNHGFFVAYSSEETDFLYRVKYKEKGSDVKDEKIIQSKTPGIMFVPRLNNGMAYEFQVQRVVDNNSYSLWSKVYQVVPDGGQSPAAPIIKAVFRNKSEGIVLLSPVPKAIGYELEYREANKSGAAWSTTSINTSQNEMAIIKGLKPNRPYEFRLSAVTEQGRSDYSAVVVR